MSKKRRQYSPEFKAKVAIACIRGDKTTAELAAQHEIHPTQINTWKRELLENAKAENDELYRQIGKLKVERDFLAERSAQLGLLPENPW